MEDETAEAVDAFAVIGRALVHAVERIAAGDVHGPGGLEGLGIAIAGEGLETPLASAVSDGLSELAESVHHLAEALAPLRDFMTAFVRESQNGTSDSAAEDMAR